ncbi:class I SAM-dependent methyltransferase [Kineococcus rubinsiae]|uniref:class I SAM-dependent methyltransferase n=1 Tax=Kineococcus rubinsiae TaxID=2609562 RepID=UPI001AD8FF4B|nr:class I SAM-dependent methyltransferase [Kineococcus rubinsiae]
MNVSYALAYRFGITPWEHAMAAGAGQFAALLDREEAERVPPFGHALDLGCGTGTHAVQLAGRGWEVSAVDAVPSAVRRTRERAVGHGVDVDALEDDVTALDPARVARPVDFFLDAGCFNGLRRTQRAALGRGVTACAAPRATLLVLAFEPGHRGPLPRGASRSDVTWAFPGWDVVAQDVADSRGFPAPLRDTGPQWYRLRRR